MKIILKILSLTFILHLYQCADFKNAQKDVIKEKQYYTSSGFALIYEDDHYKNKVINKKINNKNIIAMHAYLKKNTLIKIINPENLKFIETTISKNANYPKIFNIVISKELASHLELDIENPYLEVLELKKNKKFIAKEGTINEEEKNVADKAPVKEIEMDDITIEKTKIKSKKKKEKNYILVIADFYYMDSANKLRKELIKKTNINTISVKKINNNKYRLLAGPFKNFNALKTTYISLNNLGFDDLNIYKN